LKLLKRAPLVAYAFIQRLFFRKARRGGVVEAAASRNIKPWYFVGHHNKQMGSKDNYRS
jgi:hypothetical protein